ncbi:MAG TPA: DNA internalization-related competence protein ComEC/Rec2 [Ignavibacteriaceae bacterium]|nr:DNA internalization-related competence protein ComEC/Rec2 [Ignavibacteriaceae bacterium]
MKNYPLVKIVIVFICGILIKEYFEISSSVLFVSVITLSLILFLVLKLKFYDQVKVISSILVYLVFTLLGTLTAEVNKQEKILLSPDIYKYKNLTVYGTISNIELIREKELIFNLDVDSLLLEKGIIVKKIKLICKIRDTNRKNLEEVYNKMLPGNFISLKGNYNKAREKRNPGEFDYNNYLNSLGISGILITYDNSDLKILDDRNNLYASIIFQIRKYLDDQTKLLHTPETAKFLKGILLGDRGEMDYETKIEFINSGVVHVLSVSGLHVGYVILIFIIFFGRLNIYLRAILTIAGIIFFMMITGNPSAMFRASVMGIVIIVAFLSNRTTNIYNSLALSALIILIIMPWEIYNPGFQLSFSGVIAMGALYPAFQKNIKSLKLKWKSLEYILLFMALSFSAQIGTLPFTLLYFGKLSIVAIIANLFVIPLTGLIVGLGIITLFINLFIPWIAAFYGASNDLMTLILFKIVAIAGHPDYSFLWVRNFSVQDAVIFYLSMIALIVFYKKFIQLKSKIIFVLFLLFNTIFFISIDDKDFLAENKFSVMAIDVGQGDALLLKFPHGKTALIDAGDATFYFDNGERIILPLLEYLGIEKIDYAFISHIDSDHYAGFVSLVKKGVIKKIIKPEIDTTMMKDVKLEKYLSRNNVPVEYYKKGEIKIDDVKIYILNNNELVKNIQLSSNDKSGILKIVYGNTSFLFTGDIESKVEKIYAANYKSFLDVDLLKVAHHGSKTSSTSEFLNYVTPQQTIISAGILNKFNHPAKEVIKRLEDFGSEIYRTDKCGALIFESDGDSIRFIDWKKQF